jgi:hypothetical protein
LWILGVSRDAIARNVGIGSGSVSRIIAEIRSKEVPDLDLLRAIAIKISSKDLDWNEVASYVRFSNSLEQVGLSESDLETLILHLESICFKTNQSLHEFVAALKENFNYASELGVSIHDLTDSIIEKKETLQILKKEKESLEKERDSLRIIVRKYQFDYQKLHGKLPDFM